MARNEIQRRNSGWDKRWTRTNKIHEIRHTIDMHTTGKETLLWTFAIRSLHNALMEDSFDKLENNFSDKRKSTEWNMWVRFIKKQVAKKRRK